jgi:uncharacterized protein (UPF0305 family)
MVSSYEFGSAKLTGFVNSHFKNLVDEFVELHKKDFDEEKSKDEFPELYDKGDFVESHKDEFNEYCEQEYIKAA